MSVMSELDIERKETERELSLFDSIEENDESTQIADAAAQSSVTQPSVVTQPVVPAAKPTPEEVDAEKRRAHEEAEAKRKAEWEAKKKAREEETLIAWEEAIDVTDDKLSEISVKRLGDMTERLTRRNMKLCVTEYIQTLCYENMKLARHAMHPAKSMINCFKYINRKALEYLKQEQKDNDEQPIDNVIGGDVPDELCYQWAEEYFMDLNAKEDKTEEDEDFVPKPYHSSLPSRSKKKTEKKKEPPKKAEPAPKETDNQMQLTFDSPQITLQEGAA